MMRPGRLAHVAWFFALGLGVAPASSAADKDTGKAAAATTGRHDPNNITGISDFMEACAEGNAKYVAKDTAGATEAYQRAIKLQPRNPLGHYLLGEVQFASGDMAAAEKSWLQADQVSDNGPPGIKAKVLFVLGQLREAQKKWEDAKAAWQRYVDFCSKHTDAAAFPASGTSRIQAIDAALQQDKAYEIVRQRIKEEKSGAQPNK